MELCHVLLPYEITLLSNFLCIDNCPARVLLPYEITLLSNLFGTPAAVWLVLLPYEITLLSNLCCFYIGRFQGFTTLWNYTTLKQSGIILFIIFVLLPYEITLLSNYQKDQSLRLLFYYPMKLHYSQTTSERVAVLWCFTTLWNYTTLKPSWGDNRASTCFTTLWNYTTLKHLGWPSQ